MKIKTNLNICLSFVILFSQSVFADHYVEGHVAATNHDYSTAVKHWGPLASSGSAAAQFNIALLYHGGLGVPFNEKEAVKWYKKSAKGGYILAQEFLAAAYADGWFGLPKDTKKSNYWAKKAEENQQN